MKSICLALLCITLVGCQKPSQRPDVSASGDRPKVDNPKVISESEAKTLVTDFVNQELKDRTYNGGNNQLYPYPTFDTNIWNQIEFVDGRWVARHTEGEVAGFHIVASIDRNSQKPKLEEAGFSLR